MTGVSSRLDGIYSHPSLALLQALWCCSKCYLHTERILRHFDREHSIFSPAQIQARIHTKLDAILDVMMENMEYTEDQLHDLSGAIENSY